MRTAAALETLGWRVAVVWECDARDQSRLAKALDACLAVVRVCD